MIPARAPSVTQVAWLIFTHEKVTCFNYHSVIDWFAVHGEGAEADENEADKTAIDDVALAAARYQRRALGGTCVDSIVCARGYLF